MDKTISWKESTITRMMKSCFDGTAFSSFIICISTAEKNAGESHCAMKFGLAASKLKSRITKPVPKKLAWRLKMTRETIADLTKKLKNANEQTTLRLNHEMKCAKTTEEIMIKLGEF